MFLSKLFGNIFDYQPSVVKNIKADRYVII